MTTEDFQIMCPPYWKKFQNTMRRVIKPELSSTKAKRRWKEKRTWFFMTVLVRFCKQCARFQYGKGIEETYISAPAVFAVSRDR